MFKKIIEKVISGESLQEEEMIEVAPEQTAHAFFLRGDGGQMIAFHAFKIILAEGGAVQNFGEQGEDVAAEA